jgi:spermidine synthase
MVQREAPRRVLVVSGIASGVLEEVFKYPVTAVDYVELNPGIGTSESRLRPVPEDPRLRMVEGDVRAFLRSEPGLFDVLLVNTPDPTTAQSNRLFTLEFFRLARSHMTDSSVLAISLLPSVEYYGDRARLVGSSVFTTLREIFPEVAVVPGDRNYFLASGTPLDVGIARLVAKRGIATTAVNAYYIDDDLLRARSAEFVGSLDTLVRRNGDLSPIAYFRQIALWLESLGVRAEVMGWATVLIVLAALGILPKVETGVYAAGFAAAGIEVIALLGYQCLYGFVYHSLWLVTGGFMAGLAAGSAVSARVGPLSAERLFLRGLIVMGLCSGGVAILLEILVRHGRAVTPGTVALLGLIALAGAATGAVFGAGSALVPGEARRIAGGLYAVDLAGSALGSLLTVVFLVPLAGTDLAAASVGVLPLAAALLYTIRR